MICSISPCAKAATGLVGTMPANTSQTEGASLAEMPEVSTPAMSKPIPGPTSSARQIATAMAMAVVIR